MKCDFIHEAVKRTRGSNCVACAMFCRVRAKIDFKFGQQGVKGHFLTHHVYNSIVRPGSREEHKTLRKK